MHLYIFNTYILIHLICIYMFILNTFIYLYIWISLKWLGSFEMNWTSFTISTVFIPLRSECISIESTELYVEKD